MNLKGLSILMIRTYQRTISLWFGPCCRFSPSCSNYAIEAIERYGIALGGWLAFRRLLRCHPFNPGGYDPLEASGRTAWREAERNR
ncbi:MAG: membrane protein insertion efficiency factor YidD [Desulfobacterota bacterium]|nr:membrane protein insertion efficiency factor YidD [Thermodesulfobacteriota bacterium]